MSKKIILSGVLYVAVLLASTVLLQIWTHVLTKEAFSKLLVTEIVIIVILGVVYVIKQQLEEDDTQGKDGYLR